MPPINATFVQETYVLVTFVNISNISVVTDLILTKHFGPNFVGALTLFGLTSFDQIIFRPNFFVTLVFFLARFFFCQNFFVLKISRTQNFLTCESVCL